MLIYLFEPCLTITYGSCYYSLEKFSRWNLSSSCDSLELQRFVVRVILKKQCFRWRCGVAKISSAPYGTRIVRSHDHGINASCNLTTMVWTHRKISRPWYERIVRSHDHGMNASWDWFVLRFFKSSHSRDVPIARDFALTQPSRQGLD